MAVITIKQLKAKGACRNQVALFRKHFGAEANVTVAAARKVATLFDWDWAAGALLTPKGYYKYEAARKQLYDEYEAARGPLYDKYQADLRLLYDKYEADRKPLDDKYRTGCAPIFARLYNVKANRQEG
jgi:hypothetical protein